ncbi:MAG: sodium:proton exchanger [Solirubrobacteraceae bacterium]|jgi:Ca2+:H+ antiporter
MRRLSKLERISLAVICVIAALAGLGHYAGWPSVVAFAIATLALAGLAWVVSFATEQVGEHVGPAATGLLQASVGNLPELFVVIFALRAGEAVVAQSAIVGSLFANALLVLGFVIVVGALSGEGGVMRFHPKIAKDATTLLFTCLFIIVLVGLSLSTGDRASHHVTAISVIAAALLLTVYLAWVVPHLRGEHRPQAPTARIALAFALVLLIFGGVAAGFVSDWFVAALAPAIAQLHVSQAFAGLVIVAIAGNAVEHLTGVRLAARGRSDLAISVVVSSVAQIAAFLYPLLVIVSLTLRTQLTFALFPVYIGALAVSAVTVWQITEDGEGRSYEGWALIVIYAILAVITLYE